MVSLKPGLRWGYRGWWCEMGAVGGERGCEVGAMESGG